jgi:transposase
MSEVTTIGLDIAKNVFQVHGIDTVGDVVKRYLCARRNKSDPPDLFVTDKKVSSWLI